MKYRFLNNIARIVMHRYREAKNTAQEMAQYQFRGCFILTYRMI